MALPVSILLPVADSTNVNNLEQSINSIESQTASPQEVLLLTNQNLPSELKKYIRNLSQDGAMYVWVQANSASGLGETLREGVIRSTKPYIARLDADDIATENRLASQWDSLRQSDADIVGAQLGEFNNNPDNLHNVRTVPTSHKQIVQQMAWRCPINHPTALFRKEGVVQAGNYRSFPEMEDWDLWARCAYHGLTFCNVDDVLVKARTDHLASRRGGIKYAKSEIRMMRQLRQLGISSLADSARHVFTRIPLRIMPAPMRKIVYDYAR